MRLKDKLEIGLKKMRNSDPGFVVRGERNATARLGKNT